LFSLQGVVEKRERGKINSLFDDKKNTKKKKQLTSRLAERDGQLSSLREEVELYDGRIQRLEDALDARTAELLALRRAAAEREEQQEEGEEEEPRQQRRRQQHQQQQHPPPLPLPSTAAAAAPSVKTAAERFAAVSLTARAVDETLPPAPVPFAETFANPASSSSRPRSPAAAAAPSPVAFVAQPPSLPSSSSSRRAGGDAAGQDVLRRLLG